MRSRKKKYVYIGFIVGFEVVAFVSGFSVGGKLKAKSVRNVSTEVSTESISPTTSTVELPTKEVFATTNSAISTEETNISDVTTEDVTTEYHSVLTKEGGVNYYNGIKETYYNLDMSYVVELMRYEGYSEEDYPYSVSDENGCKMLGNYIMVAANLDRYPKGTIVETSLGMGIVCDTGEFAISNPNQFDIAVTWK